MNVLFFSYRGAWGSGGTFSFAHALEDVASAIQFVRADSTMKAYGTDPERMVLLGHSMGGWLALMATAADSSIACTVAQRQLDSTLIAYSNGLTAPGGPLRAASGQSLPLK
jgi:acetyl esterase/lipase